MSWAASWRNPPSGSTTLISRNKKLLRYDFFYLPTKNVVVIRLFHRFSWNLS